MRRKVMQGREFVDSFFPETNQYEPGINPPTTGLKNYIVQFLIVFFFVK